MLVFQRCFNLCFIALLVHLLCAFHFVLASPGKKTASVNALVGVPVPGKSAERANPLSSSSPALSPEQSAAKRPKFDLNRTPSPETEEGARSASPRLSRGVRLENNALSVKSASRLLPNGEHWQKSHL